MSPKVAQVGSFLVLLIGAHAAEQQCVDKLVDCPRWKQEGECEKNKEGMQSNCPLSCGVCSAQCFDKFTDCAGWKAGGECEKNKEGMSSNCPLSCGVCSVEAPSSKELTCIDLLPDCERWNSEGECQKNPESMNKNCPLSCGVCTATCFDKFAECPTWKGNGECENNKEGMSDYCKLSCGFCSVSAATEQTCEDKDPQCPYWKDNGECQKNKDLGVTCPLSCGVCTHDCFDRFADCPTWGADGECEKNKEGMSDYCMLTCGTCGTEASSANAATTEPGNACEDKYPDCPAWQKNGECENNPQGMHDYCKKSCGVCGSAPGNRKQRNRQARPAAKRAARPVARPRTAPQRGLKDVAREADGQGFSFDFTDFRVVACVVGVLVMGYVLSVRMGGSPKAAGLEMTGLGSAKKKKNDDELIPEKNGNVYEVPEIADDQATLSMISQAYDNGGCDDDLLGEPEKVKMLQTEEDMLF